MKTLGITGMGILSSIGADVPGFAASLRRGTSGIAATAAHIEPKLSVSLAAEIRDFAFLEKLDRCGELPDSLARKARRLGQRAPYAIQVSILTALEAWRMAGLCGGQAAPERSGLVVAGQNTTQNYQYGLIPKFMQNPEYLSARYGLEFLDTNQIGVLSELLDIRGEGLVVGGASASGNVALIKAFQAVRSGLLDVCLVAGIVADLSPMDIQGFYNMGAMGGRKFAQRPDQACRPFDAAHEGFIYGQAGACVILESAASAERRGVPLLADFRGGSMNLDGNSSSNPTVEGEMKAMLAALEMAGVSPAELDYVNAHGSSSPLGDKTEAEAISRICAGRAPEVRVNATKGLTGHCLYSAGVVEAVATVIQIREGFLHPNKNLEDPIHKGLRFCGAEAADFRIGTALSNSFGFGGINTSIVLGRHAA